jgi:hypothetical protein
MGASPGPLHDGHAHNHLFIALFIVSSLTNHGSAKIGKEDKPPKKQAYN